MLSTRRGALQSGVLFACRLTVTGVIVSTSIEGSDLTVGMKPIVQLKTGGMPARQMTSGAVSYLIPHVIHSAVP
jgi:hypothetical protein